MRRVIAFFAAWICLAAATAFAEDALGWDTPEAAVRAWVDALQHQDAEAVFDTSIGRALAAQIRTALATAPDTAQMNTHRTIAQLQQAQQEGDFAQRTQSFCANLLLMHADTQTMQGMIRLSSDEAEALAQIAAAQQALDPAQLAGLTLVGTQRISEPAAEDAARLNAWSQNGIAQDCAVLTATYALSGRQYQSTVCLVAFNDRWWLESVGPVMSADAPMEGGINP